MIRVQVEVQERKEEKIPRENFTVFDFATNCEQGELPSLLEMNNQTL